MKIRVLIAFGGVSVEHEISILSAMQAVAAFDKNKYECIPLYIAKDSRFYSDPSLLTLETFQQLENNLSNVSPVSIHVQDEHYELICMKHKWIKKRIPFDIVYPILHGTNGEDGSFQGYLTTLQIPYVGCSVLAGAIGQDKIMMKMILQDRGFPIPAWFYWEKGQPLDQAFLEKADRFGYPSIIKPSNLGSSIGIEVVNCSDEIIPAMERAFRYDQRVIIERRIENLREINCSLMRDKDTIRVSVLEEVFKQDAILSFDDKYVHDSKTKGMVSASRMIPANVSSELQLEIQQTAKDVYHVLQSDGIARIDFLMDNQTQQIYVNEINTIPGSLSFYLWEHSGIQFDKLLDQTIKRALFAYQERKSLIFTHKTNVLSSTSGCKGSKR